MNNKNYLYLTAILTLLFAIFCIAKNPLQFLLTPMGIINIFWIVAAIILGALVFLDSKRLTNLNFPNLFLSIMSAEILASMLYANTIRYIWLIYLAIVLAVLLLLYKLGRLQNKALEK